MDNAGSLEQCQASGIIFLKLPSFKTYNFQCICFNTLLPYWQSLTHAACKRLDVDLPQFIFLWSYFYPRMSTFDILSTHTSKDFQEMFICIFSNRKTPPLMPTRKIICVLLWSLPQFHRPKETL